MTAEAVPSGLHTKLAEVMSAITHIDKSGVNEAQKYNYTRQADVAHAVRTQLAERKVTCTPTDITVVESRDYESRNGGRQHFLLIRTDWTFTDAETGEKHVVTSLGAGTDSGDKAPYKAMTGASKYAELLSFLIPTGDDPEKDQTEGSERASEERLALLGRIKRTGTVAKGSGLHSNLAVRQTTNPEGMVFGFRLEKIGGDAEKKIPQVIVDGPLGDAYVTALGDPADLLGKKVTVEGLLYSVRVAGRRETHRLLVERIAGDDWTLPADTAGEASEAGGAGEAAPPPEAESVPLPFDLDAVDREAGLEEALAS